MEEKIRSENNWIKKYPTLLRITLRPCVKERKTRVSDFEHTNSTEHRLELKYLVFSLFATFLMAQLSSCCLLYSLLASSPSHHPVLHYSVEFAASLDSRLIYTKKPQRDMLDLTQNSTREWRTWATEKRKKERNNNK